MKRYDTAVQNEVEESSQGSYCSVLSCDFLLKHQRLLHNSEIFVTHR